MEAAGRTSHRLGKVASRVAAAGNNPEQPGEPPKMDLQGVEGVEEARARTPPALPSTPSLLRCGGGAAERRYCWA